MFLEIEEGVLINLSQACSIDIFIENRAAPEWQREYSLRITTPYDAQYFFRTNKKEEIIEKYNKVLDKLQSAHVIMKLSR